MKSILTSLSIVIFAALFISVSTLFSCGKKQTKPGTVMFADSFSVPTTIDENWEIFDFENPLTGPSVWVVKEGRLYQTSNIYRGGDDEYEFYEGSNILMRGALDWPNYQFSVNFGITGNGDGVGMLFRYQDDQHYYRFIMVSDSGNKGPFMKLQAKDGNKYITLAENKKAYDIHHHHRVVITASGKFITVIYDNQKIFSVEDERYLTGRVGLMCYAEQPVFDNVKVLAVKLKTKSK
jgi:hypothetical protein